MNEKSMTFWAYFFFIFEYKKGHKHKALTFLIEIRSAPDPKVIKLFSCSTQLSMKIFLLINVKMPTIVVILTFKGGKNSILGLSEPKISHIFILMSI